MINAFILILGSLMLPAQQSDEVVRLRDGRVLIGIIENQNLDGFDFVAATDGGRLSLVWTDLFPGESDRLHEVFGYVNETVMPMVTAQRVLLNNGRELIGRVVSETNSLIELRVKDTRTTFSKQLLAAPIEDIEVEASMVLTAEQFYAERAVQIGAGDGMKNYDFAKELEMMFAFEQAKVHFLIAREVAATADDAPLLSRIDGALAQLERMIANKEEATALEHVKQLMHRERFTDAKLELAQYDVDFPNAALRGEYLKLSEKFEKDREKAMVNYLRRHWFMRVMSVMRKQALEKTARLDSLMAWVESEAPQIVRQQFVDELVGMHDALDVNMIDELWSLRVNYSSNSHTAGYGDGTWILGEERARTGLKATGDEEEQDGKTQQQREMEDRMKRYLDNLKNQQSAAQGSDSEVSPEDWWKGASVTSRLQWLLAYYSEFTGDYQLSSVKFTYCPTCGGLGHIETLEISSGGSARKKFECPTCHGVQVKRSVNFK
ncbi:MAG: hypothetical protein OSB63_03820 [Planctomycetota bacterium]|nr:hypothetical protein [Planctomycetota bacterium]